MIVMVLHKITSANVNPWVVWTPIASVIIAALSLFMAIANRKIAKKALSLSALQEERRTARLDLRLTEAISWRPAGENWRLVGMHILAVNPTDRDGSLVSAELHVAYTIQRGDLMVVKIPHVTTVKTLPEGITPLEIPARLPSNGAISGWLAFKIDDALINKAAIEGYDAVVHDSRGPTERVQAWVLREITDAEAT